MLTDVALLILRVTIGLLFAVHGAQKLFGWFGGPGFRNYMGMMEKMGMRPTWFWTLVNALAEFGGGLLMVLGVLASIAAAAIISTMLMAIIKVHAPKGFFNKDGGYEFPLTLLVASLAIGLAGPGALTLNPVIFENWPRLTVFVISVLIGLIGVGAGLLISQRERESRGGQPKTM